MPLSKNIISKNRAEEIAIAFTPGAIKTDVSASVKEVMVGKDRSRDFRLDKIVSQMTGIEEIERQDRIREIEKEALTKSKEVQESAYKEAYDLGYEEGKKEAIAEKRKEIDENIENLYYATVELKSLKLDLFEENKRHIVQLTYYLAKRLMMKEIEKDKEYILSVIKKSLEMAHSEENITIHLNPLDVKFIESNKEQFFKDLDLQQNTKLEIDESLKRGGAIIETNYGVIDSTLDQRMNKLADLLNENKVSS